MLLNCRCIKNKWVFKIKHNNVYWTYFVECEYSQVTWIDFSKNYCPVVNDINFCILHLVVIYFGYSAEIVDVETDFLYGDLKEEIYMEYPQGISDVGNNDCII